jgi:transporter family protein
MNQWMTMSLAAVVLWGLWAFLPTIATATLDPRAVVLFQAAGSLAVLVFIAASGALATAFHWKGATLAVASGVASTLGSLAFVYALTRGRATNVLIVTSLYPVVSLALAFLVLGETMSIRKLAAIACAIAAVLLSLR